jgi:hypothetical protein
VVDRGPRPEVVVVVVQLLETLAQVVHLQLEQFDVLRFLYALVDRGQLLETDSIGFEGDYAVDLVVEVLQLFPQLLVGGFVVLYQPLLLSVRDFHYIY